MCTRCWWPGPEKYFYKYSLKYDISTYLYCWNMSIWHPPVLRPGQRIRHQPLISDVPAPAGDRRGRILFLWEHISILIIVTSIVRSSCCCSCCNICCCCCSCWISCYWSCCCCNCCSCSWCCWCCSCYCWSSCCWWWWRSLSGWRWWSWCGWNWKKRNFISSWYKNIKWNEKKQFVNIN